jgi:predicted ATPase
MNKQTKLPEPEVIEKTTSNLRNICQQLDELTLQLDELIAIVEANIRANIINVYHPKKEVVSVREAKGDVGLP